MGGQPFMQLYPGDYLADTQHLTTEQHGAYLLLLMAMWTHGGAVENDDKKLARIARVNLRRWHFIRDDVMALMTIDGAIVTQKRLQREHQKAVSKSEKRSASGRLGGRAKSLKSKEPHLANVTVLPKHSPEPDTIQSKHTLDADAREQSDQGKFLDIGWEPDATGRQFAGTMNFTDEQIDDEAEKFRDYYSAAVGDRSRSRNWSSRWRKWIRTAVDNQVNLKKVHANGKNQNPAHRRAEPLRNATRKYLEELDSEDDRAATEPARRAFPQARH